MQGRVPDLVVIGALVSLCALAAPCRAGVRLGVTVELATELVQPGDEFWVKGRLINPGPEDLVDVPVFFVLDVYGELWFWPSWSSYSPPEHTEIDYRLMDLPVGWTEVEVVPPFPWPDTGSEGAQGLCFYGAMLDQQMTEVVGDLAAVAWGYGPMPPPRLNMDYIVWGDNGLLLRLDGEDIDLGSEDIRMVVDDLGMPLASKGVAEDGLSQFVISFGPGWMYGDYPLWLEVDGQRSSNSLELRLNKPMAPGKPFRQVMVEMAAGMDALCADMRTWLIPESLEAGLIPAEAQADLMATVDRADNLFTAFLSALQDQRESEQDYAERLWAQNGIDDIFAALLQTTAGSSRHSDREWPHPSMCCVRLDATGAGLSAIHSVWTMGDLAAVQLAFNRPELIRAPSAAAIIGMHFAVEILRALIHGFFPTDL